MDWLTPLTTCTRCGSPIPFWEPDWEKREEARRHIDLRFINFSFWYTWLKSNYIPFIWMYSCMCLKTCQDLFLHVLSIINSNQILKLLLERYRLKTLSSSYNFSVSISWQSQSQYLPSILPTLCQTIQHVPFKISSSLGHLWSALPFSIAKLYILR